MKLVEIVALAVVALLFVLWPVPHTISVRDTLLLLGAALFGYLMYRTFRHDSYARLWKLRVPIALFFSLTAWMFFVAVFVSNETRWSLDEIRGQWLKAALVALMGGMAAVVLEREPLKVRVLTVVCVAMALHVLYVDIVGLVGWFRTGNASFRIEGLTDGPDKSNYLANYLVVFVLTEVIVRATYQRRVLPLGLGTLSLFAVIALGGVYFSSVRNGLMELTFLSTLASGLFLFLNRRRWHKPAVAAVAVSFLLVPIVQGFLNYKSDGRWNVALETIPIAWDTDKHKAWLNDQKYPFPTLADGRPVDTSTYLRVAWIKEGMKTVLEHPLGVGFGRNAFGHARLQKYGESGRGHSHSGIIDLAIGVGIPGALLWTAFLASLLLFAYRGLVLSQHYHALLLFFLTATFSFRMLVDSVVRDHVLQMFMFLVGLSAATIALGSPTKNQKRSAPMSRPVSLKKARVSL